MARGIVVAFALFGAVSVVTVAQGCSSTVSACTNGETRIIQASSFDQSCKVDSDCVAVSAGDVCSPCIVECPSAAINVSAKGQYDSVLSNTAPSYNGDVVCNCPEEFFPCCRDGICHADFQCQNPLPVTEVDAEAGADANGPAECVAAGGECLVGGSSSVCAVVGPQDCNPDRGPSGSYCCLTKASVADAASESGSADADACAPSGCDTACPAGTQDVSSMVNGCLVWQCCVPHDAAADAMTDATPE